MIFDVSSTLMLMSDQIFPGVPTTICSAILSVRSYRSSRRMVLMAMPDVSSRCLPILCTSPAICLASSRVGQRHRACGAGSVVTDLSMPSTKHAVFPVPL